MDNFLIISDLQIPFEHPRALEFCKYVKKHYKIKNENVYNVGDEVDLYYGSKYLKNPDFNGSPIWEIAQIREKLKEWVSVFPQMKLCVSNHGTRYLKRALEASIPSVLLRRYEEVLGVPDTWKWQKKWLVKSHSLFIVEHGDDWGGQYPHVQAAMCNGISTALGHHHVISGVENIETAGLKIWGMATGCLIDKEAVAFEYAKAHRKKAIISLGVVVGGRLAFPILI